MKNIKELAPKVYYVAHAASLKAMVYRTWNKVWGSLNLKTDCKLGRIKDIMRIDKSAQ